MVVVTVGLYVVAKRGHFYIWGYPINRRDDPMAYWALVLVSVFIFCCGVFSVMISKPWK